MFVECGIRNVRPAIIHCYRNWSAGPARRFAWGVIPPLVKYCTLWAKEWPQSACQRKTLYCAVREELSSATWRTRRQIRSDDVAALNLFLSQNPRGCARPPRVAQVSQRARLAYLHSSLGRTSLTVLADLSEASLARLSDDGFNPYHSLLLRSLHPPPQTSPSVSPPTPMA